MANGIHAGDPEAVVSAPPPGAPAPVTTPDDEEAARALLLEMWDRGWSDAEIAVDAMAEYCENDLDEAKRTGTAKDRKDFKAAAGRYRDALKGIRRHRADYRRTFKKWNDEEEGAIARLLATHVAKLRAEHADALRTRDAAWDDAQRIAVANAKERDESREAAREALQRQAVAMAEAEAALAAVTAERDTLHAQLTLARAQAEEALGGPRDRIRKLTTALEEAEERARVARIRVNSLEQECERRAQQITSLQARLSDALTQYFPEGLALRAEVARLTDQLTAAERTIAKQDASALDEMLARRNLTAEVGRLAALVEERDRELRSTRRSTRDAERYLEQTRALLDSAKAEGWREGCAELIRRFRKYGLSVYAQGAISECEQVAAAGPPAGPGLSETEKRRLRIVQERLSREHVRAVKALTALRSMADAARPLCQRLPADRAWAQEELALVAALTWADGVLSNDGKPADPAPSPPPAPAESTAEAPDDHEPRPCPKCGDAWLGHWPCPGPKTAEAPDGCAACAVDRRLCSAHGDLVEAPDGWVSREGDPPCAREGCGHAADNHDDGDGRGPWCADTCSDEAIGPAARCPRYVGPVAVVQRGRQAPEEVRVLTTEAEVRIRGILADHEHTVLPLEARDLLATLDAERAAHAETERRLAERTAMASKMTDAAEQALRREAEYRAERDYLDVQLAKVRSDLDTMIRTHDEVEKDRDEWKARAEGSPSGG